MKNLIYVMFFGFVLLYAGNSTIVAKNESFELESMYRVLLQKENIQIEEWSVMARETSDDIDSEEDFSQAVDELKKKLPDFNWEINQDSEKLMATGTYSGTYSEEIQLVSTLSEDKASYMIYEMTGSNFGNDLKKRLNERKKGLFRQNTTFFTCVKGEYSDTMYEVLSEEMNRWLKEFHAVEIESLKEDGFVSVTAQSSMIPQFYVNDHYNLQIAMRNDGMGTATSFVIGTPIITFEY